MSFLIFCCLVLVGILVWLWSKVLHLSESLDRFHSRLGQVEDDLERLKEEGGKAPAARPEPAPSVAPWVSATVAVPPPIPVMRQTTAPAPVPFPSESAPSPISAPPLLPEEPAPAPQPPAKPRFEIPSINWEHFMGVKLFAWIGGLALFLGVVFFVKYSFENNLISPELRVAIGFLTGLGLLVGGFILKRKDYAVTSQTLCATGVVILYATTFACRSIYHFEFFDVGPTFALMALITTAAFLLAVRMEAQVVAVLGILGGFLTPFLISTGVDNPLGLFGYIALLDIGLIAVALHRRWHYLTLLGAVGTAVMQIGWVMEFFAVSKVFIAMAVFLGFDVLFLLAFALAARRQQSSVWMSMAAIGAPVVTFGFVFYLLSLPAIGSRPPVLFSFVLGADLCLLALVLLEARLHLTQLAAGVVSFLVLSIWTLGHLTNPLLNWALVAYLVFAVLHAIYPLVLQRLRPGTSPVWWGQIFPPLALLLVMLPMFRFTEFSGFLWPCVLLIDMLAIGLAVLTASLLGIVAVLLLTAGATLVWLTRVPAVVGDLPEMLLIIGGFAVFFFVVGIFAGRKLFGSVTEALGATAGTDALAARLGLAVSPEVARAQIPAMSAILPFLLLIMVVQKLPLLNPSPIFGLALLMIVLLLGVTRMFKLDALAAVGLACTLALEHVWHKVRFQPDNASVALAWYLGFFAIFTVFPFIFRKAFAGRTLTWAVAALAGPAHFYLVHNLIKIAYPNDYMGLIPAAFAIPSLISLVMLIKQIPADSPQRMTLFAWFGGVALFFITLIFPIQFERQWITIGWALEGLALLWLFGRVPHKGLPIVGVGLLVAAFARLALNPAVLSYQERADVPIWNWYLYSYGMVSACLFVGARLLWARRQKMFDLDVAPILTGLGAALVFLLINIEIADYFTPEGRGTLVFEFRGNFLRDMTYTIAWALYALVLLIAGLWKRAAAARYAGLGLLSVTLLKLFFHDLAQLAQLYRIGAFIAVAIIAILASFLYQRFYSAIKRQAEDQSETGK